MTAIPTTVRAGRAAALRPAPRTGIAAWASGRRAGIALTVVAAAFLLLDAFGKLARVPEVVEGTAQLGYPVGSILAIGLIQLACVTLYAIPRTAVLGALLLTGYLGGAVATHVRIESPLFTHILFPIYVAVVLWGGLYLRDERLRALLPLRR